MIKKVNICHDFLTYSDLNALLPGPFEIAAVKGNDDTWIIFEEGGEIICRTPSEETAEFIAEALAAKEIIYPMLVKIFDIESYSNGNMKVVQTRKTAG